MSDRKCKGGLGGYSGFYADCRVCGRALRVLPNGKLRAHKPGKPGRISKGSALTDEIASDVAAGGELAAATAQGLVEEQAALIAGAPDRGVAADRYLAFRTSYRSRGLGVPMALIEAFRNF